MKTFVVDAEFLDDSEMTYGVTVLIVGPTPEPVRRLRFMGPTMLSLCDLLDRLFLAEDEHGRVVINDGWGGDAIRRSLKARGWDLESFQDDLPRAGAATCGRTSARYNGGITKSDSQ